MRIVLRVFLAKISFRDLIQNMEPDQVIEIVQQTLFLTIKISTPIMIIGLLVGLIVALFQALTQIQEMTLAFVPKIVAIFVAMMFMFPTFAFMLSEFTVSLSDIMIGGDLNSVGTPP